MEVSSDSILVDIQQILFGQITSQSSQLNAQINQNSDFSNLFEDLLPEISQLSSSQIMPLPSLATEQFSADYINRQQSTAPTTNVASLVSSKLNFAEISNNQSQHTNLSTAEIDNNLFESTSDIDQLQESPIKSLRQDSIDATFIAKLDRVNLEQQQEQLDIDNLENVSDELFELSDLKNKTIERPEISATKQNINLPDQFLDLPEDNLEISNTPKLNSDIVLSDKKVLTSEQSLLNASNISNTADIQALTLDTRVSLHKTDLQNTQQLVPLSADQDFAENFAEQMQFMISSKKQQAQIQLDPAELGKLEVQITNTKQNEYVVNIVAQSDQAQQFLEQNASRLKENFANQELQFSFSKEQDQSNGNRENMQKTENQNVDFKHDNHHSEEDVLLSSIASQAIKHTSLVNIFA